MPKAVEKGDFVTALCWVPGKAEQAWHCVTREGKRVHITTHRGGTGSQLVRSCEAAASKSSAQHIR